MKQNHPIDFPQIHQGKVYDGVERKGYEEEKEAQVWTSAVLQIS